MADTAKTSVVNAVSYPAFAAAATTFARRQSAPWRALQKCTSPSRRSGRLARPAPQLHIETKISPLETACMRAALDRLLAVRQDRLAASRRLPDVYEVL
jgi:hypothetical protein